MRSIILPRISASRAPRAIVATLMVCVMTLTGCGVSATPDLGTHGSGIAPAASASPTPAGPTVVPTTPSIPSTSAEPSSTLGPSTAAACPTTIAAGIAPSDRLIGVTVEPGIGLDKIVFTFGPSSGQPSGIHPTGEFRPTSPPFSSGGSGLPVGVAGHRFIAVTFRDMAIADEQGNPSYTGPDDTRPNALAVRELRLIDDFEGVVTWIVGVDGPGCVAVASLVGPARLVLSVSQL